MAARTRWRRLLAGLELAAALVALLTTQAVAQSIGFTSSVAFVRGTYPDDRVESLYAFNGVDVTAGLVRASASVPFMRQQTTPLVVDPLVQAVPAPQVATGFGDPLIRLDVRVFQDRARRVQASLAGSVKIAAVDASSGRGSGVADYAVGGSVLGSAGRTSLLADLLFWKYGDPPGIDYKDSLSYSVGVGRLIGRSRWSTLVSLSGFTSLVEGAAPPVQLNLGVLALTGASQSVAVTAGIGLTDSSSDFSLGLSWRIQR